MEDALLKKIEVLDKITDIVIHKAELSWHNNEFTQVACLQTKEGALLSEKDVIAVEITGTKVKAENGREFACRQLSFDGEGCLFLHTKGLDCYQFSEVAQESLEKILKKISKNTFSVQLLLA